MKKKQKRIICKKMNVKRHYLRLFTKSQIKLFESIAVLIVFVFIIAIGMRFYTSMQMQEFEDTRREFFQLNSVKVATIVSNLDELSCSFSGIGDTACFDLLKIASWDKVMQQENLVFMSYYLTQFGNSEIVITQIFPEENSWSVFEPARDTSGSFDRIRVPIKIHDPITRKNSVGVLDVKTYFN